MALSTLDLARSVPRLICTVFAGYMYTLSYCYVSLWHIYILCVFPDLLYKTFKLFDCSTQIRTEYHHH